MLKRLDHLVIVVPDLSRAVQGYSSLGFTVVPGGRHMVGTHNALVSFEDGSYLELIAFYEPRPDHRWWTPLQGGGGLVDYCLETDDLIGDTRRLREAGVWIGAPEEKNRIRLDGYDVRWMYSLPLGEHRGAAPFIIQDLTPRAERVPRPAPHPNGVTGVRRVILESPAHRDIQSWYRRVLGIDGAEVRDDETGTSGLRFRIGPHEFDVLPSAGPGMRHAAVLGSSKHDGTLDPAAACGARLRLAGD